MLGPLVAGREVAMMSAGARSWAGHPNAFRARVGARDFRMVTGSSSRGPGVAAVLAAGAFFGCVTGVLAGLLMV